MMKKDGQLASHVFTFPQYGGFEKLMLDLLR